MWALALYLLLALGISFLCSLLEAVILSLSRGHIESLITQKHPYGHLLKELKTNIENAVDRNVLNDIHSIHFAKQW